jgi:tetratricopeptide (TPR) repeat protein
LGVAAKKPAFSRRRLVALVLVCGLLVWAGVTYSASSALLHVLTAKAYRAAAALRHDGAYFARAEAHARAALRRDPQHAGAWAELARLYHEQYVLYSGRTADDRDARQLGIEACRVWLQREPNRVEALELLGGLYATGDPRDLPAAIELYRLALSLEPRNHAVRNDLALAHIGHGDLAEAETLLRTTIEGSGLPAEHDLVRQAREYLGRLYTETRQYAEAERVLQESAAGLEASRGLGDYWGCPYQALGVLYNRTGRTPEMVASYVRAADLETNKPRSQYAAAVRLQAVGDFARAATYLDRAIALKPEPHYLALRGVLSLFHRRYDEAEQFFARAEQAEPGSTPVLAGRGHLAIIRKEYDAARRLLTEASERSRAALERRPADADDRIEDPMAWSADLAALGLSWIHANHGEHAAALEQAEAILVHQPDHVLALLSAGNALAGLQRAADAEAKFRRVLALDPENPYAMAELGLLAYNRGANDEAERFFQQALQREPEKYTCPYEGLGLVYLRQGRIADAERNFERAIALDPSIEYKKFNGLARIRLREGDFAEAARLLRQSIANYPADTEARDLLAELERTHPAARQRLKIED